MCKFFLEDGLFKKLFSKYFNDEVTEQTLVDIDMTIMHVLDSELTMDILNYIKAGVVSGTNYSDVYKYIRKNIDSRGVISCSEDDIDKLILSLTLKYLISSKSDGIESLISKKRDFITEAIATKYKVPQSEVTDMMRDDLLNNPNDIYSVDDPPIEGWDRYFFNICSQVARNSKCLSRRIGAVLVKDKSIISTGYNGPPRGIPRCNLRWVLDEKFTNKYKDKIIKPLNAIPACPRHSLGAKSGELLDICVAGHAEENSILNAARMGICTKDSIMYMTCGIPCFRCLIKIINAGISEIVVTGLKFYDDNSEFLINNSKIKVRLYDF